VTPKYLVYGSVLGILIVAAIVSQAGREASSPAQQSSTVQTSQPATWPDIEVYFSPKGGCTDAIVREINNAKSNLYVQAYSFTSLPIAKALIAANNRDVLVKVILDKSQRSEKYREADFLAHEHVMVFIDPKHAIAHNKIMIIDRQTVITGSFNFTKAAEDNNAENLLIIHDKALAEKYMANWVKHFDHSEVYEAK
jgi:phosphatidylserine/phosphatidylglycerophosphate/cardiolipin synthase-like enzyme